MKIAVTGATGFIGSALVHRLADEGHELLALGRRASAPHLPGRYAAVMLPDGVLPGELHNVDLLIHVAAHVADGGSDQLAHRVTVDGTARLLDALSPTTRLIVIGSASVYDPRPTAAPRREDEAPVAPTHYLNAYARAKAAQERLVATRRPDALILRPRAVWGVGDRTLLPRLLRRVRGGRLILPRGAATPGSTTHRSSLEAAVVAALAHPELRGAVNVADATPRSVVELLTRLFVARGLPLRLSLLPSPLVRTAAAAIERLWTLTGRESEPPLSRYAVSAIDAPMRLDLRRLHEELGVVPDVALDERIEELARSL